MFSGFAVIHEPVLSSVAMKAVATRCAPLFDHDSSEPPMWWYGRRSRAASSAVGRPASEPAMWAAPFLEVFAVRRT
jgi:hypothetical protein